LTTAAGTLVLRCWPADGPSAERLTWIHAVLAHVAQAGFDRIAPPIPTALGETFVRHAGHLWELAPWLAGRADYATNPSDQRLSAATQALAEFHRAAALFVIPDPRRGEGRE